MSHNYKTKPNFKEGDPKLKSKMKPMIPNVYPGSVTTILRETLPNEESLINGHKVSIMQVKSILEL